MLGTLASCGFENRVSREGFLEPSRELQRKSRKQYGQHKVSALGLGWGECELGWELPESELAAMKQGSKKERKHLGGWEAEEAGTGGAVS